jgi:hypothetical protein
MSKSQEYIEKIFSDVLTFEHEVLHVKCDEDRKEIMILMCRDICYESRIAASVNFLKIKSLEQMDFSAVTIVLVELLIAELKSLLEEKRYTAVEIENITKDKQYLKFMYTLMNTYSRRFSSIFYKEVVNTFFELLGVADKPDRVSPVVLEVINGDKKRKSLLEQHSGGQILYKPEQAWMRVKQARDDKKRKSQVYQIEIAKLVRRVDELKLHISAITAAKGLSMSDVKNVSSSLLLDMFSEDDVQLHTKKTMFSYVNSSDMIDVLINTARQAQSVSKTEVMKEDFKRIEAFFVKCKKTNTNSFLENRLKEFKLELEVKSSRYREQHLKLQSLRNRPLDSFDITLKKVKETMVYNLQNL